MNLWFMLIVIGAAAKKSYHSKLELSIDPGCNNAADTKALRIRGFRLVVFEKNGNWGKVTATLVGSAKTEDDKNWYLKQGASFDIYTSIDETKHPEVLKALETASESNVLLYMYVDNHDQNTPLNFGAPVKIYKRPNQYGSPEDNPYHDSPVRIKSVKVSIGLEGRTLKVVIPDSKNDSPGPANCKESTTNWIVRAGIYRLSPCADKIACQGHQWDTTYFDPYDGYVRI